MVKRVVQYFRFPDRPIKGGDILDFWKGGNLRKGGVDIEKEGYEPPYQLYKDHQEGSPHKLSFCLMNSTKTVIGKISKNLLDKINKILILNTNVNQWKNTTTVIDRRKNGANKKLAASSSSIWKTFSHRFH